MATLLVGGLVLMPGCIDSASLQAFRDAASASLQSGLKAIFNGLVEGAFAALQPEAAQNGTLSSGGSSTSTSGSTSSDTTSGSSSTTSGSSAGARTSP